MSDMSFGIVANVTEVDRLFRLGSKAWIIGGTGGNGWDCFVWHGISRSGRRIDKWAPTHRFRNFRAAWIPPHLNETITPIAGWTRGSRPEMEEMARKLNEHADAMRAKHPQRKWKTTEDTP